VCYSVLQCVAVCCSVLQCAAVCCSVLQRVAVYGGLSIFKCFLLLWLRLLLNNTLKLKNCRVLQSVAACCSMLQYVAVCCSVLQCVVVYCCKPSFGGLVSFAKDATKRGLTAAHSNTLYTLLFCKETSQIVPYSL